MSRGLEDEKILQKVVILSVKLLVAGMVMFIIGKKKHYPIILGGQIPKNDPS
jgi:hypothetical protein